MSAYEEGVYAFEQWIKGRTESPLYRFNKNGNKETYSYNNLSFWDGFKNEMERWKNGKKFSV